MKKAASIFMILAFSITFGILFTRLGNNTGPVLASIIDGGGGGGTPTPTPIPNCYTDCGGWHSGSYYGWNCAAGNCGGTGGVQCVSYSTSQASTYCQAHGTYNLGGLPAGCFDFSTMYTFSAPLHGSGTCGIYDYGLGQCNSGKPPKQIGCFPPGFSSGPNVVDSASFTLTSGVDTRPEMFAFTASVAFTNGGTPSWTISEQDITTNGTTVSTTSTAASFTIPHQIAATNGHTYLYTLQVHGCNSSAAGTQCTGTKTFTFKTFQPASFTCNTPGNGRILASDLAKDVVEQFNSDNNNGCASSYGTKFNIVPVTNSGNATQNAQATTYNGEPKDSILYYPGYDNVVVTSDFTSGNVWAMTWAYSKDANVTYTIDPTSVKVIKLLSNGAVGGGGIADMEFDQETLNPAPSYFWVASQTGFLYRIPFSSINTIVQDWLTKNQYDAALSLAGSPSSYQFSTQNYINGVKVINGNVYYNAEDSSTGHREVRVYNASTGAFVTNIDTGYNGATVSANGNEIMEGANTHLDGMTASPDNHYLFVSVGASRVIYVISTQTNSIVGLTVVNPASPLPDPPTNGGFDGIEDDANGQIFLADETIGIYTVDSNAVITTAQENGNNLLGPFWVNASQYVPSSGENYDDIAPLSGTGSAQSMNDPIMITGDGNTFTDGAYSISNLLGKFSFSQYADIAGATGNTFTNASNGTGSLYSWEFQGYNNSGLDHINGQYATAYGYDYLYNQLCQSGTNSCQTIASFPGGTTMDNRANGIVPGPGGDVFVYNNAGGTLTINADNGGIYGNGILFVSGGGQINIIANHVPSTPALAWSLLIITKANITIYPSSYYSTTNNPTPGSTGTCPAAMGNSGSPLLCQWLFASLISDGNISIAGYSATPNYMQPLVIKGMLLSYGQVSSSLSLSYLNQWWPSVFVDYDPGIINNLSQYFAGTASTQQLGL